MSSHLPEPETEVTVVVRAVMTKQAEVYAPVHTYEEWDTEPDGSRACFRYEERDDVKEAFCRQDLTLKEILTRCMAVCRQLTVDGHRHYAQVSIDQLADACDGWEEEELEVF